MYTSMASRMFFSTSRRERPWETQPGRVGQTAT